MLRGLSPVAAPAHVILIATANAVAAESKESRPPPFMPESRITASTRAGCRGGGVLQSSVAINSLFVWLVADGGCWFVLREKYYWLVVGG
jgi:hypothetical protein